MAINLSKGSEESSSSTGNTKLNISKGPAEAESLQDNSRPSTKSPKYGLIAMAALATGLILFFVLGRNDHPTEIGLRVKSTTSRIESSSDQEVRPVENSNSTSNNALGRPSSTTQAEEQYASGKVETKAQVPALIEGAAIARFTSASTDIAGIDAQYIKSIMAYLNSNRNGSVTLIGYASSEGNARANQLLSKQRAIALRRYLIQNGIPGDRLRAKGAGTANPIGDNATETGRQSNRRVEISYDK